MATTPASQPPVRQTSGWTSDPPSGPLADSGMGNPFFYHQFADDFDNALGSTGLYTDSGTGSVAHTAGDGGLGLFSTLAGASTFAAIQLPAANFTLPGTGATPPASSTSMKKLFYLCRLQLSDVTLSGFIAGLCATSTTLFTTGVQTVLDGLFFYKAPGSAANLSVINVGSAGQSPSGSAFSNTFVIPTSAYTLVNGVNIDLAMYIDRNQNLSFFVGSQLVGWLPQSGTGPVTASPANTTILPVLGPAFRNLQVVQGASPNFNAANPVMFTQQNLSPTLGVSNGVTAAIKTMTADFHCVQKER